MVKARVSDDASMVVYSHADMIDAAWAGHWVSGVVVLESQACFGVYSSGIKAG